MNDLELPSCMLPFKDIAASAEVDADDVALAVDSYPNPLPVDLQPQTLFNWCWAAVTSALEYFYQDPDAQPQCGVATQFLVPLDCCNPIGENTIANPHNRPYDLGCALDKHAGQSVGAQISLPDLQQEITGGRPVCCIINEGTAQHVVLAVGFTPASAILINDPVAPGPQIIPWNTFCGGYGQGFWAATIKTKQA